MSLEAGSETTEMSNRLLQYRLYSSLWFPGICFCMLPKIILLHGVSLLSFSCDVNRFTFLIEVDYHDCQWNVFYPLAQVLLSFLSWKSSHSRCVQCWVTSYFLSTSLSVAFWRGRVRLLNSCFSNWLVLLVGFWLVSSLAFSLVFSWVIL